MSAYVDDMRAPFGRMVMCHMTADTTEELLAMADRIGVARRWLQKAGTWQEHFDISLSKRALAIKAQAVEVTRVDAAERMMAARKVIADSASYPTIEAVRDAVREALEGRGVNDLDEAMQREDFLRVLALALASNGVSSRLARSILDDIEEQGYTYRLTTHDERFRRNDPEGFRIALEGRG